MGGWGGGWWWWVGGGGGGGEARRSGRAAGAQQTQVRRVGRVAAPVGPARPPPGSARESCAPTSLPLLAPYAFIPRVAPLAHQLLVYLLYAGGRGRGHRGHGALRRPLRHAAPPEAVVCCRSACAAAGPPAGPSVGRAALSRPKLGVVRCSREAAPSGCVGSIASRMKQSHTWSCVQAGPSRAQGAAPHGRGGTGCDVQFGRRGAAGDSGVEAGYEALVERVTFRGPVNSSGAVQAGDTAVAWVGGPAGADEREIQWDSCAGQAALDHAVVGAGRPLPGPGETRRPSAACLVH